MKSYYEILEVSEKASNEVIEKAYKVLAKKNHPDTQIEDNKSLAEENMKKINEAYEILSDGLKRQEYDRSLNQKKQQDLMDEVKKYTDSQNTSQSATYNDEQESSYINNDESKSGTYTIYYTHIHKRSKLRNIIALIVAVMIMIMISWILWAIPPIRKWLTSIYNENEAVRFIVNLILEVFKIKW